MSSINAATPFTPGYNPQAVQPQRSDKVDKAAEKAREAVNALAGTAVAAEATKDRLQGGVLDIRV